ncbi:MAG TPA: sugar phosphate isomerase/epimerase family protein [Fimbriimonas sp.]|nr:sugar phosphate isomerase/epimerase family protein [Fimbriimonas sp.]
MIALSWYSLLSAWREGQMPVITLFEFAAEAGYEAVEILDAFIYPVGVERNYALSPADLDLFCQLALEAMAKTGLSVSSVAVTNDFNFADSQRLAVEQLKVKNGVYLAQRLGAKIVRVFAGNPTDTDAIEMVRYRAIGALKQAHQPGVMLALENHGPTFNTPYRMNSILESVDPAKLGVCFDVGNFTLADYDVLEACGELSNVQLIHVKDFVLDEKGSYLSRLQKHYSGCRLGEGQAPLIEALSRLPIDSVPVVVELECGADGLQASRAAREWLAHLN